jgi:hypothetical protein
MISHDTSYQNTVYDISPEALGANNMLRYVRDSMKLDVMTATQIVLVQVIAVVAMQSTNSCAEAGPLFGAVPTESSSKVPNLKVCRYRLGSNALNGFGSVTKVYHMFLAITCHIHVHVQASI